MTCCEAVKNVDVPLLCYEGTVNAIQSLSKHLIFIKLLLYDNIQHHKIHDIIQIVCCRPKQMIPQQHQQNEFASPSHCNNRNNISSFSSSQTVFHLQW